MDPMNSTGQPFELETKQEQPKEPVWGTRWARAHPYTATLSAVGALFVIGALFIAARSPVTSSIPTTGTIAWGGAGTTAVTPYQSSAENTNPSTPSPTIMQQTENSAPYNYSLPAPQTVDATTGAAPNDTNFDYDAFIAMLTKKTTLSTTTVPDASVSDAYAYIPTGLVSTQTATPRTRLQDALYSYGNDVGSIIQSFEQEHPNETQILTDQAQDRTDATKAAALVSLANGLSGVGDSLLAMDSVPSQMTSAHQALGKSYQQIGKKLALISQAESDASFVAAVEAYDSSVNDFTTKYVALANLFAANGVTFMGSDPGNVFTFTSTSAL
jgi:hypothetical protein